MKESYLCKLKCLLLCLLQASLLLSLPAAADAVKFDVSGYNVTGDNPLSDSHTKKILKPFIGDQKDIEGLQSAAAALEQALRNKGYNFSRVVLLQQSLSGGVVELRVVAFKLGKVSIEGARHYDEANIRASIPIRRIPISYWISGARYVLFSNSRLCYPACSNNVGGCLQPVGV